VVFNAIHSARIDLHVGRSNSGKSARHIQDCVCRRKFNDIVLSGLNILVYIGGFVALDKICACHQTGSLGNLNCVSHGCCFFQYKVIEKSSSIFPPFSTFSKGVKSRGRSKKYRLGILHNFF
jgi:hypothetical protein